MLTKQEVIYHFDGGRILPDWISRKDGSYYLPLAQQMLSVYQSGEGVSRKQLHRRVQALFDSVQDCPPRRIAAFQKLLDEGSQFARGRKWTSVRRKVYELAIEHHPLKYETAEGLFGRSHAEAKEAIANQIGLPWEEIEANLFADVMQFQLLSSFDGYSTPEQLLSRYNVAQTQGVLFDALWLNLQVRGDLQAIVRQIKLSRLLHTIERVGREYRIVLDGPASVLRETRRYGSAMAKFLPALLSCKNWTLTAQIKLPNASFKPKLYLDSSCGLKSPIVADESYDSSVEANFAEKWGDQPRDGWHLQRENRILHKGQKVFIPDFVLTHESGREVHFEIAGFWTKEYWSRKLETLQTFAQHDIIVAAPESIGKLQLPQNMPLIRYKTAIKIQQVLSTLNTNG